MLELRDIKKSYVLEKNSDLPVLKGINLVFENNEFVSILGPSGCGKTTMLNILGGLDRYTDGDLLVDGVSTKMFTDKNWDNYRNRRIGIVFQNYNLIPHLSVLSNVELAMTLSGVSLKFRKKRAEEALIDVGLKEEMGKKPNQLSGGQMQRVAIARAIVNDPGVILADEPTGALDSKTSGQIMDILQKISRNHLVLMVTHNEEIAKTYSTRIIRMKDGMITSDEQISENKVEKKPVSLSSTIELDAPDITLVDSSFAGKVNLELAKSKRSWWRRKTQEKTAMNFTTAINISSKNLMTKKGRTTLTSIAGSFGIIGVTLVLALSNGFRGYVNRMERETLAQFPISVEKYGFPEKMPTGDKETLPLLPDSNDIIVQKPMQNSLHVNTITKDYIDYLNDINPELINSIKHNYSINMNVVTKDSNDKPIYINTSPSSLVSSMMNAQSSWQELPGSREFIEDQYDVIVGKYPEKTNELIITVDKYNRISYNTMQALGFDVNMDSTQAEKIFTFNDIIAKEYKLFRNNDVYDEHLGDKKTGFFLKSNANVSRFAQIISILYSLVSDSDISAEDQQQISKLKDEFMLMFNTEELETKQLKYYTKKTSYDMNAIYDSATGETMKVVGILRPKETTSLVLLGGGVYHLQELTQKALTLSSTGGSDPDLLATELLDHCMLTLDATNNPVFSFLSAIDSNNSIDLNTYMNERLQAGTDKDITSITIFPKSFKEKKAVVSYLDSYNKDHKDNQIVYTDLAAVLTSSVGNMISIISIVLICFAAIALVTSSVMISIITFTSVIERTKEIGILRSIGARKKDVGRLFRAETVLIGLFAGVLGVIVTYILCIPINAILNATFPDMLIGNIASLDPLSAIIMITVSVLLTLLAGLIPSRMAAKKDPVICLRTE